MKYTRVTFFLGVVLCMAATPFLRAQNAYVESAPVFTGDTGSADQPDSVLTIKKRVDEVNVLLLRRTGTGSSSEI